jgi:hypothetical protein
VAQRFLALDWDQQQLHLVAATASGRTVRFQRAVLLEESSSPNLAQAAEQGQNLRERLKAAGIAPAPVLACVGRDRVIVKEVRYPAVPPHEEPAIVRFQAVKELTDASEEVVIDYVSLGSGSDGQMKAQVVVVRRELVHAYQTLCQAAGLKLAGLVPRPYGTAACLRKLLGTALVPAPEPPDAAVALVIVGERWAEFCVVRGGVLLQARALTLGPGLAGEIRRNLTLHSGQFPQSPVQALYLALSGEQAALREKLVESLEIPVHLFDPFGGADAPELPTSGRGTFAGAIGLLHLKAERGDLPVNFAQARQVRPPRDPNQRLYILVAALILVLLGGGFVVGQMVLEEKREAVAAADTEIADLNKQLARERVEARRMEALHEWEGVPWPDEVYELTARMPTISQSFKVKTLEGSVLKPPPKPRMATGARNGTPAVAQALNARPVGRFRLTLDAPDSTPLKALDMELIRAIGKNGAYYRPEPHTSVARSGNSRRAPGLIYRKDILIRKRPPEEYTQTITIPAPPMPVVEEEDP